MINAAAKKYVMTNRTTPVCYNKQEHSEEVDLEAMSAEKDGNPCSWERIPGLTFLQQSWASHQVH